MNNQNETPRDVASHVATWWKNSACRVTAVLVGVSGGADSVCLVRAVASEGAIPDVKLVVGHVDHGIRGAESQADSEWVGELADQLGLDYEAAIETNIIQEEDETAGDLVVHSIFGRLTYRL